MLKSMDNNGRHIDKIIETTQCDKHRAGEGMPCYQVHPSSKTASDVLLGVCGRRIKRAGYNGKISVTSMSIKSPGGRTNHRKP